MDYRRVLSIVSFVLVLLTLLFAIVSDAVIFADAIFGFLAAILVGVATFVFMFILMVLSIMLMFGIFLLEEHGFWPLNTALGVFREALGDIQIAPAQILTFQVLRICILAICITALVLAIIALHRGRSGSKAPLKPMSIIAMIFSILGILTGAALLSLTAAIA